jgi:membrane protein DedA with SNARE-associated domain
MSETLATLLGIALATLVSEDLTLLGTGVLIREDRVPMALGVAACAAGIFLGDVGLWIVGRIGGRGCHRLRDTRAVTLLVHWLDRSPGLAIVVSRVLPGARLPMYLAAGAWGKRPAVVVAWMALATAVWTPLVVGSVALTGSGVASLLGATSSTPAARVTTAVVAATLLTIFAGARRIDLDRLDVQLDRWRRWEFWPAWVVTAPVVAWVILLAIRHRSLTLFTAANPGIADGGFVGESKADILAQLPAEWTLPWVVVEPGTPDDRLREMRAGLATLGRHWPLVGKPDVSQRGAAVRFLASEAEASAYLAAVPERVILQVPHDGPFEAGVYYQREPGATRGRVTSITDKRFPSVIGDGTRSIDDLIAVHPRLRLQQALFRMRHTQALARVPAVGEMVVLGRVGNHAQGAEFRDGRNLWTEALERRFDAIAQALPNFHLGRFDVRYRDRVAFMAGDDLAIVELNGVTAEPTHIYDPAARIGSAWRTLMDHWTLAFRFGALNVGRGCRPSSVAHVTAAILRHLRTPATTVVSD